MKREREEGSSAYHQLLNAPLLGIDCETRVRDRCSRPNPAARLTKYLTTILRLSFDSATVLRSNYDGRLIYKTSYEECEAFLRYDSLANRKIVRDCVRKKAYNIPNRNLCTL